jgi:membrane fusion protein, heavy metal efflux system
MSFSSRQGPVLARPAESTTHIPSPIAGHDRPGWLGRTLPTLVIFATLGTVLAWGHFTGWTLPKFSALTGSQAHAKDDWCSEHGVPDSQCVECKPALLPRPISFGWCKVHGVHECPHEHAEIAQTKVSPEASAADLEKAQRALDFTKRPENNNKCKLHLRRIQFASQEAIDKAGIEVEPVWTAPVVESVQGNGEIAYDQTSTARLSARLGGTVFGVYKKVGDSVKKGDILALVDAAEVGKAKSEFMKALLDVRLRADRMTRLEQAYQEGALALRTLSDESAALGEARIRLTTAQEGLTNLGLAVDVASLKDVPQEKLADSLRFLGLTGPVVATLDPRKTTGNLLTVTAPFDGVVVSRQLVTGEMVDHAKTVFVIADVRQMCLSLDVRLEDANLVALGQEVRFQPNGNSEARGKITWISTEADHKTRTVKVRASLENGDGRLRANTFGSGKIILREESKAIVVPTSAVHWEGCCHIVFVRDKNFLDNNAPKVFHVRTVRLGARDDKQTEIIAGVLPGEVVATRGSAIMRAELLKDNLGEGCTCGH